MAYMSLDDFIKKKNINITNNKSDARPQPTTTAIQFDARQKIASSVNGVDARQHLLQKRKLSSASSALVGPDDARFKLKTKDARSAIEAKRMRVDARDTIAMRRGGAAGDQNGSVVTVSGDSLLKTVKTCGIDGGSDVVPLIKTFQNIQQQQYLQEQVNRVQPLVEMSGNNIQVTSPNRPPLIAQRPRVLMDGNSIIRIAPSSSSPIRPIPIRPSLPELPAQWPGVQQPHPHQQQDVIPRCTVINDSVMSADIGWPQPAMPFTGQQQQQQNWQQRQQQQQPLQQQNWQPQLQQQIPDWPQQVQPWQPPPPQQQNNWQQPQQQIPQPQPVWVQQQQQQQQQIPWQQQQQQQQQLQQPRQQQQLQFQQQRKQQHPTRLQQQHQQQLAKQRKQTQQRLLMQEKRQWQQQQQQQWQQEEEEEMQLDDQYDEFVEEDSWTAPMPTPPAPMFTRSKQVTNTFTSVPGQRITVTNLDDSVTQDDIVELFGVIGGLRKARLIRPGVAEVIFATRKEALLAAQKYHRRELDGIPMQVKLAGHSPPAAINRVKQPAPRITAPRPNNKQPCRPIQRPISAPAIQRPVTRPITTKPAVNRIRTTALGASRLKASPAVSRLIPAPTAGSRLKPPPGQGARLKPAPTRVVGNAAINVEMPKSTIMHEPLKFTKGLQSSESTTSVRATTVDESVVHKALFKTVLKDDPTNHRVRFTVKI